jgi:hypothetical protein
MKERHPFLTALTSLAVFAALSVLLAGCEENTALRNYVNSHVTPAAFESVDIADAAGGELFGDAAPDGAGESAGGGVILASAAERAPGDPDHTVIKIVLRNSQGTAYTPVFLGNDAGLIEDFRWHGAQTLYCKLKPGAIETERALDITLRLTAPPGYKPPDDMPLPLACARLSLSEEARVVVFPSRASVERGGTFQFWAAVTGSAGEQAVQWSVDGNDSHESVISPDGLLTVAPGERAAALTVRAVSPADDTVSGTAVIKVVDCAVTFGRVDALQNAANTTERLILYFSRDIDGLEADDITFTPEGIFDEKTGVLEKVRGAIGVYELPVSVLRAGTAEVTVTKSGYTVNRNNLLSATAIRIGILNHDTESLKDKFGVTSEKKQAVTDTFNKLHNFIEARGLDDYPDAIKLGDYIDLEGGISVSDYADAGGFSYEKSDENTRLIVVGINSFQERTESSYRPPEGSDHAETPHVVFHFQNIPVKRRMEASDTNQNGYLNSEMRKYLVPTGTSGSGVFLTGLTNAGVPEGVLWVPTRSVYSDEENIEIKDKIWIPTEREMFVGRYQYSNDSYEWARNQTMLEYYNTNEKRIKIHYNPNATDAPCWYWEASRYKEVNGWFCDVEKDGKPNARNASENGGVAPAFCVK